MPLSPYHHFFHKWKFDFLRFSLFFFIIFFVIENKVVFLQYILGTVFLLPYPPRLSSSAPPSNSTPSFLRFILKQTSKQKDKQARVTQNEQANREKRSKKVHEKRICTQRSVYTEVHKKLSIGKHSIQQKTSGFTKNIPSKKYETEKSSNTTWVSFVLPIYCWFVYSVRFDRKNYCFFMSDC